MKFHVLYCLDFYNQICQLSYYKISLKFFQFFSKAGLEVDFRKYMEYFHIILFHVI